MTGRERLRSIVVGRDVCKNGVKGEDEKMGKGSLREGGREDGSMVKKSRLGGLINNY